MNKFEIKLESDALLGPQYGIHVVEGYEDQLIISDAAIRRSIRKQFRKLKEMLGLTTTEDRLFGFLAKDKAQKSLFSVTAAIATDTRQEEKSYRSFVSLNKITEPSKDLNTVPTVAKGKRFFGTLAIDSPQGSREDLAIKMALLSITRVGWSDVVK